MADAARSSLTGKRVVITRPLKNDSELERALRAAGAVVQLLPLIRIEAAEDTSSLDAALGSLEGYGWFIFTSQNAVAVVAERLAALGKSVASAPASLQVAVVGPATAEAAREAGFRIAHESAGRTASDLIGEVGGELMGKRVLLPRSDRAAPELVELLRGAGAEVKDVVAYRIVAVEYDDGEASEADAILFFSPSAVQAFRSLRRSGVLSKIEQSAAFGSIGPVTEAALREAGLRCDFVAEKPGSDEIVSALAVYLDSQMKKSEPGAIVR